MRIDLNHEIIVHTCAYERNKFRVHVQFGDEQFFTKHSVITWTPCTCMSHNLCNLSSLFSLSIALQYRPLSLQSYFSLVICLPLFSQLLALSVSLTLVNGTSLAFTAH